MTRGKHATAATTRRVIQTAEADLATYQRKVRDLTAEIRELRDDAKRRQAAHAAEVRRLKVEINEGTSPALRVAQAEARDQRDRAQVAEQSARNDARILHGTMRKMIRHMVEGHHMTNGEALGYVMQYVSRRNANLAPDAVDDFVVAFDDEVNMRTIGKLDPAAASVAAERIVRARKG